MADQGELLPIEHRSLQPKRLKNYGHVNGDAIYAGQWLKINKEMPNLLGHILAPDDGQKCGLTGQRYPAHVTRRDAAIAASVIQWLGTAVGDGFVRRCQAAFEKACAQRTEIGVRRAVARSRIDKRTPLERRKARLDAARKRLKEAAK